MKGGGEFGNNPPRRGRPPKTDQSNVLRAVTTDVLNDMVDIYCHQKNSQVEPNVEVSTQRSSSSSSNLTTSPSPSSNNVNFDDIQTLSPPRVLHGIPRILLKNDAKGSDFLLYLGDEQINKILEGLCEKFGGLHNVGYFKTVHSKYSMEGTSFKDIVICQNKEMIDIILVPIHSNAHFTLGVFKLSSQEAWYFDSFHRKRGSYPRVFNRIRTALEAEIGQKFHLYKRAECNNLINFQKDKYNCGTNVLRICEEIFRHGKSKKLFPFDGDEERKRMSEILELMRNENWYEQWPETLQVKVSLSSKKISF
uniref:Ubiquitin-like protease family profile domain-containing protein n=1 Tax=Panagrolaimus davidi TaxID=227884 RepID=A0A914Q138_9BILA